MLCNSPAESLACTLAVVYSTTWDLSCWQVARLFGTEKVIPPNGVLEAYTMEWRMWQPHNARQRSHERANSILLTSSGGVHCVHREGMMADLVRLSPSMLQAGGRAGEQGNKRESNEAK